MPPLGRMASDSQTAYAFAICFDLLLDDDQKTGAATRLDWLVRKNAFNVGTGFVRTPLIWRMEMKTQPQLRYDMEDMSSVMHLFQTLHGHQVLTSTRAILHT